VDLLISEWLGIAAFVEGMLYAVLDARDQSLGPNGRMMPSKVCVLLAPLDDPILYHNDGPGFWREPIHNLDLSSLQEIELAQGRTMQIRVEPAALLAPGQSLLELDLLTASEEDVSFDGQLEFVPVRDGVLNGFCVWFTAELSPHVHLDTGPLNPETHWAQTYVSFAPRIVRAGERLTVKVDFSYQPDPGYVDLRLSVGDDHLRCLID
jgi:hypothetical protein